MQKEASDGAKRDFLESPFDAPKMEEKVLECWDENHTFEKSLEKTKSGKPFTFYDGPPFATGLPHYGHILASTIKDVIPRYQTMRGHFVRRRWGWDCHGLPIEEIVERKLGISGKKQIEEIGIGKFNETCRAQVLQYAEEWGKMVRRMARWVEFDNSYKTMDREYMESVWWAFKQIYDKGLVYEGRKVLMYCPRCETPISNFEVAMDNSYKDVKEEALTVKFHVISGQKIGDWEVPENTFILAWTTTPWTLPGNVALAVGKDVSYTALRMSGRDGLYIIASELVEKVAGKEVQIVHEDIKGSDLVGLSYKPLFDVPAVQSEKAFKVYAADFVNTDEGTGIVHTAVVYGEDDYQLGIKEGLPVVPLLDEKGKFNDESPELIRGQYFKDAEEDIKADLEKRDLIFAREHNVHSYPHCWRCSTPLYYNAIPAWFINIQKIKKDLINSNTKEINWFPEHLKHGRYEKSVESAPDWNISRNRYWGNPIPIWKCGACEAVRVVGSVAELGQDVSDMHRPYIDEVVLKCEKCGGEARRIPEIFDSWVEAGSMPFSEYHYPFENKDVFESRFPAQFVAEYIAQTRAWFYVMHVISHALFGKAPFENVVTTGTILAEDGSKMSKSKNNYPDPWIVVNKYGVDSLRFYLMNSVVMQADNLNFSLRDLESVHRKVVMIYYNVYNYFATYAREAKWKAGAKNESVSENASGSALVLDKWIVVRTRELVADVSKHLDSYDTVWATRTITQYIDDLSTWYVRRSRGRTDAMFFETLYSSLVISSKVMAPFMPYLSEAVYSSLVGEFGKDGAESVHLTDWPEAEKLSDEEAETLKNMAMAREAASLGQAIRKQKNIPVRQPLAEFNFRPRLESEYAVVVSEELNIERFNPDLGKGDMIEVAIGSKGEELLINLALTTDLQMKGLTRNIERFVQEARKKHGFRVGETAELVYKTDDEALDAAVKNIDIKKTYISCISKNGEGDFPDVYEANGKKLFVKIAEV